MDCALHRGGTLVWVDDLQTWEDRLLELADALVAATGSEVCIGVPPITTQGPPAVLDPVPTALLATTMNPPVTAGPFNEWGMPAYRWGVPEGTTRSLFTSASGWVMPDGQAGEVLGMVPMPATVDSAPDLLTEVIDQGRQLTGVTGRDPETRALYRQVVVEKWGQTGWSDADPAHGPAERAEALLAVLEGLAADLDLAILHPIVPSLYAWPLVTKSYWRQNRHLWSQYVPDAYGAQILTRDHLTKAQDLSGWQVERVGPDRFLVRARDLEPWVAAPDAPFMSHQRFPDPDLRTRARADFGAMILTREKARTVPGPKTGG